MPFSFTPLVFFHLDACQSPENGIRVDLVEKKAIATEHRSRFHVVYLRVWGEEAASLSIVGCGGNFKGFAGLEEWPATAAATRRHREVDEWAGRLGWCAGAPSARRMEAGGPTSGGRRQEKGEPERL